jgi:hypothetical protein
MMMPGDELGFYVHSIIHKHYEISVVLLPSPRGLRILVLFRSALQPLSG